MYKEERVRVLPKKWCRDCGIFLERAGCDCDPTRGTERCCLGNVEHIKDIVRFDHGNNAHVAEVQSCSQDFSEDELDRLYGHGVWDSRWWRGGSMTDYLPKGVTLENWRYARDLAEDDVCIMLQDYTYSGYT